MTPPNDPDFSELSDVDRLIHEPSRLAIMAVLAGCESADFEFLLRTTGLTKGNLSAHAIKLEQGGYLVVEKGFNGKTPFTRYSLTPFGRKALTHYRERLKSTLDKFS